MNTGDKPDEEKKSVALQSEDGVVEDAPVALSRWATRDHNTMNQTPLPLGTADLDVDVDAEVEQVQASSDESVAVTTFKADISAGQGTTFKADISENGQLTVDVDVADAETSKHEQQQDPAQEHQDGSGVYDLVLSSSDGKPILDFNAELAAIMGDGHDGDEHQDEDDMKSKSSGNMSKSSRSGELAQDREDVDKSQEPR